MFKYTIEATVIIIGILLSFYIEEIRTISKNIEVKNELLEDLNRAVTNDLAQIDEVQNIIVESLNLITELQNDMNNTIQYNAHILMWSSNKHQLNSHCLFHLEIVERYR